MSWRWTSLALILLALGLALAADEAQGGGRPDFSGHWRLNKEKGDDPRGRMPEAQRSRPPGGRGGPMGGGPGGPGRGRGGPRPGGPGGSGQRPDPERLRQHEAAQAELVVRHQEPELTIEDANGQRRFLYTDGRESRRDGDDGASLEVKTSWKGARVVVETRGEHHSVVEAFQLAGGGRELIVETRLEGQDPARNVSFKRLYDLVTDQPAPVGPPAPTPLQ